MFSYNPCREFSEESCLGVAACAIQRSDTTNYMNLGFQTSAKFVTESDGGIQVEYEANTENFQRIATIKLVCDELTEFDATGATHPASGIYVTTLSSKYACLKDSTGLHLAHHKRNASKRVIVLAYHHIRSGDPEIYINLGSPASAKFVSNPDGSTRLEYIADSGIFLRVVHVYLKCDEATKFKFIANGVMPASGGIYTITLTSKYDCQKGITTSSQGRV